MVRALRLGFPLMALAMLLFTCKGKDELIPSYIQIDSVAVAASGLQGNAIHEISALQVFVDGEMLGVFEIPATIPALYSGKHKVSLIAVTFINGSGSQRAVYRPLLIADTNINLVQAKVTQLKNIVFRYRNNTQFVWAEDFEDGNSSLVASHAEPMDSMFISTVPFDLKGRFTGNTKALEITIKGADTSKYLDAISFNAFSGLPVNGADINLEFDIKTPVNVQVALDRISGATHQYVPFLVVNGDDSRWKRFYLNLVPEIASQPSTNTYKIYFTVAKPASVKTDVKVYLDNIRLCYLP